MRCHLERIGIGRGNANKRERGEWKKNSYSFWGREKSSRAVIRRGEQVLDPGVEQGILLFGRKREKKEGQGSKRLGKRGMGTKDKRDRTAARDRFRARRESRGQPSPSSVEKTLVTRRGGKGGGATTDALSERKKAGCRSTAHQKKGGE